MKIRKNDQVKILSGKDRGKIGKVLRVSPKAEKAVIEGLNLVKKHNKARRQGEKGQRVSIPAEISVSSVMLVCPKCSKPARIGFKQGKNSKFRVCKKCKNEI